MSTAFILIAKMKRQNFRGFTIAEAEELIAAGTATGGMIPKLQTLMNLSETAA